MPGEQTTYKDAGVDIDAAETSVQKIRTLANSTHTSGVFRGLGHFGAMFRLPLEEYSDPIIVSSMDGVGTKLKAAIKMEKYDTIGEDLVNHCINDILTTGAKPLFFLDYLSLGKISPEAVHEIVSGMVRACKQSSCALIGGETAEMPDLYRPGEFDLAGTIVGIVEKEDIIDGSRIEQGDVLLGLASNGLHTNGYSLARKILFENQGFSVADKLPDASIRNYHLDVAPLLKKYDIHGLAHVTGGGIEGNVKRILPDHTKVEIDWSAWQRPAVFRHLQRLGNVPEKDMRRTFNLGIGFVMILPEGEASSLQEEMELRGESSFLVGRVLVG
jgi:phosphoribosylformylglycinamidine cyclo-ligase